jgi:hypothetical protein
MGKAGAGAVIAMNLMKLEVIAGTSFGDNNTAIIWEDFELTGPVGTTAETISPGGAVYATQTAAADALRSLLADDQGLIFGPSVGDSGLQDITNLTFNVHIEYQSACTGAPSGALPIVYFGGIGAWGAKITTTVPMAGTIIRVIYFD